jgi:hypothetical protein
MAVDLTAPVALSRKPRRKHVLFAKDRYDASMVGPNESQME